MAVLLEACLSLTQCPLEKISHMVRHEEVERRSLLITNASAARSTLLQTKSRTKSTLIIKMKCCWTGNAGQWFVQQTAQSKIENKIEMKWSHRGKIARRIYKLWPMHRLIICLQLDREWTKLLKEVIDLWQTKTIRLLLMWNHLLLALWLQVQLTSALGLRN